MSGRSVAEWIGSSPDAKVPDRVKLRIWLREKGKCHLSGRKILPGDAWDLDHKVALCNGGVHAESNLFPALRDKHREKTAADVAERARIDRLAKSHAGIRKAPTLSHPTLKRTLSGRVVDRRTGQEIAR